MKSVQEAKKRGRVPASERKSRIVAVEEHFARETYFDEVANLRVPADEEPERAFMSNLAMDAMLRDLISQRNAERLFRLPASSPVKETQI